MASKILHAFSQLSIALTEHILGTDACWFFTGYFVQVRLAAVCIGFWFGKYLSRAVSEQMWARLRLKGRYGIPKPSITRALCLPWFNSRRNSREGREEWEDLEFDQISPVRPWLKVSKRTLLWSTWIWILTGLLMKGQRLGVWLWMVWRREKGPHDFIDRIWIKTCSLNIEVVLKGSKMNA